ncbi:hypothetical protein TTHERM_00239300 (macronuclear) [Tetrahymena thermophila SB210]|uniref:Uncharacterized protein n=1 Tax=Tetrahymena thermophila (strain SB210) TaxID=312017 RepID=I7MMC9_TETTS|nr:hypothetical protein TTHERM_00239300 [Tetrahymena thermophila SB210]EAS04609.2 hypothetical protein TTHERM_00239300 [Tetrahymena thermophila SB210]|eukprot:XP_001024854.2 hypothetical protein TTHERM_00239300 [Tetrahymena thermophila SB210]
MSESHLDPVQSTNQTIRTTQATCPTLPAQQPKQILAPSLSQTSQLETSAKIQVTDPNNIYAITNQIQQRSIDYQKSQRYYLNDEAIIEEFQKLELSPFSNQASSPFFTSKSDYTQNLKRSMSPTSSYTPQSINSGQQNQILQLQRELQIQKNNYIDLFYNFANSNESLKNHVNNLIQLQMERVNKEGQNHSQNDSNQLLIQQIRFLQEQLKKANDENIDLSQKFQLAQNEKQLLRQEIELQREKLQKQQNMLNGPMIRYTQIREEVRKEIEGKLISQHKEEMNAIITKFSREKAKMIKTIELQKLRILDNERIMLQMEGDLETVRDSYSTYLHKSAKNLQQIVVDQNSFEIPEEQTLNKSDQSDTQMESAKRSNPATSSVSSVKRLANQFISTKSSTNLQQNSTQKHHRKNKSYENPNQLQNLKQIISTPGLLNSNNLQASSNTNLPSSQASSGRHHHQKYSSISTPQSIPASDHYKLPNQFDFYSPDKAFLLNQKYSKQNNSHSKYLSQSQITAATSKSNSKLLNQSQAMQQVPDKRPSLNSQFNLYDNKVNNQQQNQFYSSSPYSIQLTSIGQTQQQASQSIPSNITPLSEQLGIRTSQNSVKNNTATQNQLVPNKNDLNEVQGQSYLKQIAQKYNPNLLNPQFYDRSTKAQEVSQLQNINQQGENYSVISSQSSPVVHSADSSVNIFKRFKNSVDEIIQI